MQCSLTLTRAARPQQHALARRGRRRARPLSTATMEPRDPASECQSIINREKLLVVGKTYCGFTKRAKAALADMGLKPATLDLDTLPNGDALQAAFASITGIKTVPQVFIGGDCLGGCDDTLRAISDGSIKQKLSAAGISTGA